MRFTEVPRAATAAILTVPATAALAWGLFAYPLPVWPLALALAVYMAALWVWPALFLIVLPMVLPALDLGAWTGWTSVGEADFFILATLAILAIRAPPRGNAPFLLAKAGAPLTAFAIALAVSAAIGLAVPAAGGGTSANPYLRPDNALRLLKPMLEVLTLLPFIRQRQRVHGDAAVLLGWGMLAGVTAIAVEATIERALWFGILDFSSGYRVAAGFSSMHVGGGHIGTFAAMSLPFLLGAGLTARRRWAAPILLLATIAGGYALIATFARTAYAAGCAAMAIAALSWLFLGRRRRQALALLLIVPIAGGLIASASFGFMRERLGEAAGSLLVRQANWRQIRAVLDGGPLGVVFGTGLGTYARVMLTRGTSDGTSDFRLESRDGTPYLSIATLTPFYIGQKIGLPASDTVRLSFQWRAAGPNGVFNTLICEKYLLYSENCRGQNIRAKTPGVWEPVSIDIPVAGLGGPKVLGVFRRPIELSLSSGVPGSTVSVANLSLTGGDGRELLTNGDFRHGMDRWFFTDDQHSAWRIFNLYLMLLFETGLPGLLSFLTLVGAALLGAARALRTGNAMGAALAGSIVSFLVSGMFDHTLEAPRLTAVFLLICAISLIAGQPAAAPDAPENSGDIENY